MSAGINSNVGHSSDRFIRDALYGGMALTPTEKRVLRLAADGLTYREIAAKQNRSFQTVKTQIKVCLSKLGARNTTHAVAIAISLDLI